MMGRIVFAIGWLLLLPPVGVVLFVFLFCLDAAGPR